MESHFSVSQSLQASVILQQQQQYVTKEQRDQQSQRHRQENQHLSFWQQLRLTAALFGVESSTAFEQVYTYLSLQYLGVPVALMSLNGILAGVSAVILILAVGYLIDKGSNPKRRKIFALVFGLFLLVSGNLLIMSACAIMIVKRGGPDKDASELWDFNRTHLISRARFVTNAEQQTFTEGLPYTGITHTNSSVSSLPIKQEAYVPLTGILGIMGYTCLDIGFDLGNPMVRAFILENSPSSQHTNLLVTATQLAALAGLLMSSMGVLDLPGVIEESFGVDGTAGTFILMLTVMLIIVISFFGCSVWTGISLRRGAASKVATADRLEAYGSHKKICSFSNGSTQQSAKVCDNLMESKKHIYKPSLERSKTLVYGQNNETDNSSTDGIVTTDDKTPLLMKRHANVVSEQATYMSVSLEVASAADTVSHSKFAVPADSFGFSQSHSLLEGIPEYPSHPTPFSSEKDMAHDQENDRHVNESPLNFDETVQSLSSQIHAKAPPVIDPGSKGIFKRLYRNSKGKRVSSLDHTAASPCRPAQPPLFNKRLVILILSTAFSVSSLIGICMYAPNAVTLGIYGADPTAELGTPENLSYKRGLRAAALGNVIFYIAYFLSCLVNNKSLKILGQGLASSRVGRVTSIIGSSLPFVYIIMSSLLGPLIDATGNVWIPLIWSCIGGVLSMAVFSILFCMKD